MKTLTFLLLLFAACGSQQSFKPGTYVNHAQSAYSVADDTLILSPNYQVVRHTSYQRPGGPIQHGSKTINGVWNGDRGTLDLGDGLTGVFRNDGLVIGNSIYKRLP